MRDPNDLGILDVEVDPGGRDTVLGGERLVADSRVTISGEAMQRICSGYQCVHCYEKFESAWPENCPACNYPVADLQRQDFQGQYTGLVEIASGITMDEVLAGEEAYLRSLKEGPTPSELRRRL